MKVSRISGSVYLFMIFLPVLFLSVPGDGLAQTSQFWGDLKPGNYGVGFKTIEKYDYSRTLRPGIDYMGEVLPGENARPIQICLWYPATVTPDDAKMVLGEYIYPYPENSDFIAYLGTIQQRELRRLAGLMGNDQGLLLDATNLEAGAVRNAPSAEGSFPLLIYFPGLNDGILDNMVLCEYLASNGYVVMTTHQYGTIDINSMADPIDLETIVRDKEFGLASIRDMEFINLNKIGAFGVGVGGLAALLLQMRNFDINAVAELSGWNIDIGYTDLTVQNPFYNPQRMSKPQLQIYYDNPNIDLSLIDSLKYSERFLLRLDSLTDGELACYPAIRSLMDTTNTDGTINRPSYNLACYYLSDFYNISLNDGNLKDDFAPKISDPVVFNYKEAQKLPPTGNQFLALTRSIGGARAVEIYYEFDKVEPGVIPIQEAVINFFGYQALQSGQNEDAIALFKLNSEVFPNSSNCWDSYSDGLQVIGDTAGAINCYRKVLEILPTDSTTANQLKETLRTNAENGITRLSGEN